LPARGEAARPGAPGVVVWVEGNRDGSGWVEREADPAATIAPVRVAAGGSVLLGAAPLPRSGAKLVRARARRARPPAA
jgi:hypothetical protein